MSIKIGKIHIKEEIDSLTFFKFKQSKVLYYCVAIQLLDEREGYLAFSLSDKLDKLFTATDYNNKTLNELIACEIEEFYFLSFEDEDPSTCQIEYAAPIGKSDVLKLYKIQD
jgi:hypothetical protein